MKKIILVLVSMFALGGIVAMAAPSISQKEIAKMAKKQAKALQKEGWKVAPGALPLEAQLTNLYNKQYDMDEIGRPKTTIGTSQVVAEFYDAATLQAMTDAKMDIARQLSSDLTAKIESEMGNKQLPQKEAASVAMVVSKSQEIVSVKLGRVIPLLTCNRELKNGNVEMMVNVGYPSEEGLELAKQAIRQKLEEEAKGLSLQFESLK